MAGVGEAALSLDVQGAGDHGGEVVGAQLMQGEPPELQVLVGIQADVPPAVLGAAEVS